MKSTRTGVLLAQLGTPDAPTAQALRPFLREFLGDPRVIEANRVVWWFVLNGIVLPRRPRRSAAMYQRIWTDKGSPLLIYTREQAAALQAALGETALVDFGMRYGNPPASSVLDRFAEKGVDRLLVFPMFPQYCAATTGSVYDAVFDHFKKRRRIPALRFVPPYPEHPAYIRALADSARESLAKLPWKPDKILISFHGVPRSYTEKGDPYEQHTLATARALASALDLAPDDYVLSYQSRFGREEWLRPYTDETLKKLAGAGVRRVAAVCPGFTVDCLETIDEIGHEGKIAFQKAGGEDLRLLPCLNAHPSWIRALAEISRQELQGWD